MAVEVKNVFGLAVSAVGVVGAAETAGYLAGTASLPLAEIADPAAHTISELFSNPKIVAGMGIMALAFILIFWGGKMMIGGGGGHH